MKNKKIIMRLIGLLSIVLFLLTGCKADPSEKDGRIQVVATTTMITDLAEVIGGDKINVTGLMGPGIDPHGFNASASDVNDIYEAEVVIYNGLDLEGQMGRVFGELDKLNKEVFVLEEIILETEMLETDEESMPNDPHVWFSVPLWARSADYLTESFKKFDPQNATYYDKNNQSYQKELSELDAYIRERVKEVPENTRYLVTAHDAFQYFGSEYGFEVVGLQGLNTQTEAGTRDVSKLAQFIVNNKIKAIFVESSVPTRTIESLQEAVQQRGWAVDIGGELYSDSLGDITQNAETYIKMYRQNIDTIVDSLN